MNANQAKLLSLPDILSRLGYEATSIKKGGKQLWYRSPFRHEKTSSFVTSYLGGKWIFNDLGSDAGGTVIDFIMRYKHYSSISDALAFLDTMFPCEALPKPRRVGEKQEGELTLFSSKQQAPQASNFSEEKQLEFLKAHSIRNPLIYSYLTKERAIPRQLIDKYLQEIKYRNTKSGKEYFAFGMKNQSGGYEIRAASDAYKFKSALKKRDITLIEGASSEHKSVNIFEGMTDFLSLLTMYNTNNLNGDAIIMHSLSSYKGTVDAIKKQGYTSINTFLDNNKAGQEVTEKFIVEFGDSVTSQSSLFEPHTDLNDALLANKPSRYLSR